MMMIEKGVKEMMTMMMILIEMMMIEIGRMIVVMMYDDT